MLSANDIGNLQDVGLDRAEGVRLPCHGSCGDIVTAPVDKEAVLEAAALIESNHADVVRWFEKEPIACLAGITARSLVLSGRGDVVLDFLRTVHSDQQRGLKVVMPPRCGQRHRFWCGCCVTPWQPG